MSGVWSGCGRDSSTPIPAKLVSWRRRASSGVRNVVCPSPRLSVMRAQHHPVGVTCLGPLRQLADRGLVRIAEHLPISIGVARRLRQQLHGQRGQRQADLIAQPALQAVRRGANQLRLIDRVDIRIHDGAIGRIQLGGRQALTAQSSRRRRGCGRLGGCQVSTVARGSGGGVTMRLPPLAGRASWHARHQHAQEQRSQRAGRGDVRFGTQANQVRGVRGSNHSA